MPDCARPPGRGDIILSDQVLTRVTSPPPVEPVGPIELKGVSRELRLWRVVRPEASTNVRDVLGGGRNACSGSEGVEGPVSGPSPYPPRGNIVVVDPNVDVGGEAVFRGGGCEGGEALQVVFDGHPVGTVNSDAEGNFAAVSVGLVLVVGTRRRRRSAMGRQHGPHLGP